jgi:diguanylate cyclase (GGDEF)-like protein
MEARTQNTLLIVDDSRLNLMALVNILKDDYIIYEATDGNTAVSQAMQHKPDLILLDVVMPDMDGFHVLAKLQEYPELEEIPVIFITGLNNKHDEKKGLILGAVDFINKPFDDLIVKLRVQHQIRIVNQLRTIKHLSLIDQLTRIPNRRYFDERLQAEWSMAIRKSQPLCLLIMDIDHFKRYNDDYGHKQGDIALQTVALTIRSALHRASDFAARWGGEEFVVLLPDTDEPGGVLIGEKVREAVEETPVPLEKGGFARITISVGVHAVYPNQTSSVDEFFSTVDKALYRAKSEGRNRVCVSE